jgi:hypothetical protein
MSLYSIAKKVYGRVKEWPLIGKICMAAKPFFRASLSPWKGHSFSTRDLSRHMDLTMQAVLILQKSAKTELASVKAQLEAELASSKERLEFVRLELFEQMQSGASLAAKSSAVHAEILNQEKYDRAVQSGCLRLNIGCGHKPAPEYLNVDRRSLPGVDIVAEAAALPFEPGSLQEIYAAHLLEHFTQAQLPKLLSYWRDLLAPEGMLKVVVPDAEAMIAAYIQGHMPFHDLREVTFGAQDYDDDFHQTMFTPGTLSQLLALSGFSRVTALAVNRVNGKCREMEFKAVKDA